MKFIVILLALLVVPVVIGVMQKGKYINKLKPDLEKEAVALLEAAGVEEAKVEFDYLDAHLSGITPTEVDRRELRQKVDDLGGKAVRAFSSNLKTYGQLILDKQGDKLFIAGCYESGSWEALKSDLQVDGAVIQKAGSDYRTPGLDKETPYVEESYFKNPEFAKMTPGYSKWAGDFLSLPGDRRIEAKGNKVMLFGTLTKRIEKETFDGAKSLGLMIDRGNSNLTIVESNQVTLNTKMVEGGVLASGTIPNNYDISGFGFKDSINIVEDPFIDWSDEVKTEGFEGWHKDYYSDPDAGRGYRLIGNKLALSGFATASILNDWEKRIKEFKLIPSYDEVEVFPSSFHYPSYKTVSQVSSEDLQKLNEVFELNEILFDSSSSEVTELETDKINNLVTTIKSVDPEIKFIIGGHASPSGDVEFNRKLSQERAHAVVSALAEHEIKKERFTITSFGSSEAKKGGDRREDRRVEILVK